MTTIYGTTGDDQLQGTVEGDVLDGGAGNDILAGQMGADTYVFGLGYGQDQIYNYESEADQALDRILLQAGVSPSDVELRQVTTDNNGNSIGLSLQLRLKSTGDTLLVRDHFETFGGATQLAAISTIEFADGTVWDLAEIERRAHLFEGTAGDDALIGTPGNDVLDGGAGNDQLMGDLGSDTYLFGQGSGHDVIHNYEPDGMTSPDRILLKPEVSAADVQLKIVTQDANGWSIPASLQLMLKSTGETLLVHGQFEPAMAANMPIDSIEFADGTVWDKAEIERRAHLIEGTAGDDYLLGTLGDDVLDGGTGNDVLIGMEGSDVYLFGQGSGQDQIYNYEPEFGQSVDRIRLKPEVAPTDVELRLVTQDSYGNWIPDSLQLKLRSSGETLLVRSHFDVGASGVAIDGIEFADGTVWDKAEIERRAHLIEGTAGNDYLVGTTGNDVLDGGLGNDVLIGDLGSDTYLFGRGSGNDRIENYEPQYAQSVDRILLKPEVTAADVELRVVNVDVNGGYLPPSLQLRLKSTGETLIVVGQFDSSMNAVAVDSIEFADGTVWDGAEIEWRTRLIEGTTGDDWLMGTMIDDVLDGGAGNDVLTGDLGSDTYLFGRGSGNDVIHNFEPVGMLAPDRIRLKPEVTAAEVELRSVTVDPNGWGIPPSLQLRLKSTGETLIVIGHFDTTPSGLNSSINSIEFADGTVWDQAEIALRIHLIEGTAGSDDLVGTSGDDLLDGGAGNDTLVGDLGSDTYRFGQGSGNDVIHNYEPEGSQSTDRVLLKPDVTASDVELSVVSTDAYGWGIPPSLQLRLKSTGETLTVLGQFDTGMSGQAIDTIEFADGTVWDQAEIERRAFPAIMGTPGDDTLVGSTRSDVINGGAGNDLLVGGEGSDVYVYGQGYGHDVIDNSDLTESVDRIRLDPGIGAADVVCEVVTTDRNGYPVPPSLRLTLLTTGETLTVLAQFFHAAGGERNTGVDFIEFADGTIWDQAEIQRRASRTLGTAGNDVLLGTQGDDVLDGGAGFDQLIGSAGSDTYVFGRGYGLDVIGNLEHAQSQSVDRIRMNADVAPDDVELWRVTQDDLGAPLPPSLDLRLKNTSDRLIVHSQFEAIPPSLGSAAVDYIEFADGTVWGQSEIEARTRLIQGTAGNNSLTGTSVNDVIDGGAGSDTMSGGLGDDVYLVDSSGDVVVEAAGAGTDLVRSKVSHSLSANVENLALAGSNAISGYGNGLDNWVSGNSASNTLTGAAGNDTLDGRAGTDLLVGGTGNDTYLMGRGYGADRVQESDATAGNTDVLQFLSGIAADQLWFRKVNSDLEVSVIGSSDKATLVAWYAGSRYHVEQFETSDGKTLLDSNVQNLVQAMAAFAPPPMGQTTLPESYAATLSPVIAANWQ